MTTNVKKRFGALDIAIVLVVAAVITGVLLYFNMGGVTGDSVVVSYTVELRGVRDTFEGLPQPGDVIYDSVKGYYLGVVSDVRYSESTGYTWNQMDQLVNVVAYPDQVNCYITIKADGSENADLIKLNVDDVEVRVGKLMYIKGKGYASYGYIVELSTQHEGA